MCFSSTFNFLFTHERLSTFCRNFIEKVYILHMFEKTEAQSTRNMHDNYSNFLEQIIVGGILHKQHLYNF